MPHFRSFFTHINAYRCAPAFVALNWMSLNVCRNVALIFDAQNWVGVSELKCCDCMWQHSVCAVCMCLEILKIYIYVVMSYGAQNCNESQTNKPQKRTISLLWANGIVGEKRREKETTIDEDRQWRQIIHAIIMLVNGSNDLFGPCSLCLVHVFAGHSANKITNQTPIPVANRQQFYTMSCTLCVYVVYSSLKCDETCTRHRFNLHTIFVSLCHRHTIQFSCKRLRLFCTVYPCNALAEALVHMCVCECAFAYATDLAEFMLCRLQNTTYAIQRRRWNSETWLSYHT